MKTLHFIKSGRDKFGSYHVLWHTGNYRYEIENRSSKKSLVLEDTSFEQAKRVFDEVLVSY